MKSNIININSIIPKKISFDKDLNNLIFSSQIPVNEFNFLIIGGAGTIGSNYIKCILKFKPKKIVVIDTNENALTELIRDLRSSSLLDYDPNFITYPVNLNHDIFDKIFLRDYFDVVANFAAHKHVRSEKDIYSIEALITNNVFGAIKLMKLCLKNPPKYFFSVSTDKAANPVNIMGASKLIMEKVIISMKNNFRVTTARFANVAFSNGSLLHGFVNRINKKQPLSCPSDIKRFFVSPEQSGQICVLATFLGKSGNIFFPKLDFHKDQIYFKEIAIEFLKMHNYNPYYAKSEKDAKDFKISNNNYPIYFFKSDTSGEKEFEEFYTEQEDYDLSKFESIGIINSSDISLNIDKLKIDFEGLFKKSKLKKKDIVNLIKKYIPNFHHVEKGKNLDQKM
tara:strand:- start:2743 stop:3927 length:1185 start_codon:yes stop_codon:yes gene_type:complete